MKEKRYWFKTKRYGWGWSPNTWEGWTVIAIFAFLMVINYAMIDQNSYAKDTPPVPFMIITFVLVTILLLISWKKGEKPRWRWGK